MKTLTSPFWSSIIFSLWLALQTYIGQLLFFGQEQLIFQGLLVLFFAFVFWRGILALPAGVLFLFLGLFTLLQAGLLLYHHYFSAPLSLKTIFAQWQEGGIFLLRTPSVFLNWRLGLILGLGLINLWIAASKFSLFRQDKLTAFAAVLVFLGAFAGISYSPESLFDKSYFAMTCRNFGYGFCWGYELINDRNREAALQTLRANAQRLPQADLPSTYHLPNHVYFIQVESLAHDVINQKYQGQELTPFLNGLSAKVPFFNVLGKPEGASANTDYVLNAGSFIEQDYGTIYKLYTPQVLYQGFKTLALLAKDKGYHTAFFHNFIGSFYNRRPHITAQGYQDLFFIEDMTTDLKKGLDDAQMFAFIQDFYKNQPQDKTFTYIITMSSHADYKVKSNQTPFILAPKSEREDYYNAVNYVDRSLQQFINNLPADSLVLIFGDHGVKDFGYNGAAFLIYDKRGGLKAENREISFAEFVAISRRFWQ